MRLLSTWRSRGIHSNYLIEIHPIRYLRKALSQCALCPSHPTGKAHDLPSPLPLDDPEF
jgi:hypothetical protein